MKLIFIAISILLFSKFVNAQLSTISVEYNFIIKGKDSDSSVFINSLLANTTNSLYTTIKANSFGSNVITKTNENKAKGLYFDVLKNEAYYSSHVFGKDFYIKETSIEDSLKWVFDTTIKSVLGYNCKSASCSFRGRNYMAFYTEQIPLFIGPWKFRGLPGLILEIKTIDGKFRYYASKIQTASKDIVVNNPYLNLQADFISFRTYKNFYRKKLNDNYKKMISDEKNKGWELSYSDNSMEQ